MMTRLVAPVLLAGALAAAGGDFEKLSPFEAVRWPGRLPEVRVDATWYALEALDGVPAAAIVDHCEKAYGARARKRFEEDLVEVLAGMAGKAPGKTVALTLSTLDEGKIVEKKKVRMTEDNRQAIWRSAVERDKSPPVAGGSDYPKLAPFTAVRFSDRGPEVEVDGTFQALVSIDGRAAGEIVDFCERTYGSRARKRFAEDLVEVLSRMGLDVGDSVTLRLRDPRTKKTVTREKVRLTAENRAKVMESASRGEDERQKSHAPRIERSHGRTPDARFRDLARAIPAGDASRLLSRADAEADLDRLEWLLENVHSYLGRVEPDHRAAFDAMRLSVENGLTRESFAIQIERLLAVVGDGHTRLDESEDALRPRGTLPFLVGEADGRLVAFRADRADFVEPAFPYLVSLDGVPADEWLATASQFAPRFSPVLARQQSIRGLRYVEFLRRVRGVKEGEPVAVGLASEDGREKKTVTLPLASRRPLYGEWPRTETRVLDGGVGYLRIPTMESGASFLAGLARAMEAFRETPALVIDVRGNGGGSRDALRVLLPYFMADDSPPRIVNVARYRVPPGTPPSPDGYLSNRFLWPATASVWGGPERRAIDAFARAFRPEWEPPADRFSDWHYFVIGPEKTGGAFRYGRPVAILQDGDCFSATDVFLGGFQGLPNVTLVGTPSGGGSGRATGETLERSGLRVRISTMASFRSDGKLYDGRGVEPDVLVAARATDFIGRTDTALDAALARLN